VFRNFCDYSDRQIQNRKQQRKFLNHANYKYKLPQNADQATFEAILKLCQINHEFHQDSFVLYFGLQGLRAEAYARCELLSRCSVVFYKTFFILSLASLKESLAHRDVKSHVRPGFITSKVF
jgi:hypothetical protein